MLLKQGKLDCIFTKEKISFTPIQMINLESILLSLQQWVLHLNISLQCIIKFFFFFPQLNWKWLSTSPFTLIFFYDGSLSL